MLTAIHFDSRISNNSLGRDSNGRKKRFVACKFNLNGRTGLIVDGDGKEVLVMLVVPGKMCVCN